MTKEIMAACPECGGREFGFVLESMMPGLYGINPDGEVVCIEHTACLDPVFICKNCYAGHSHEAAQDGLEGLALPITEG